MVAISATFGGDNRRALPHQKKVAARHGVLQAQLQYAKFLASTQSFAYGLPIQLTDHACLEPGHSRGGEGKR